MATAAQLMTAAQTRAIKKSLKIDGVNCDYWFYPATKGKSAKARNIVLVHGYRGDHHGLESFAGGLDDFNVYAPDIPGFGSSTPLKNEHTLENYANWLAAFTKALEISNPIAIGHSFGTLMVSAVQAKEKFFSALVCINPVAGGVTKGLSRILMNFVKGYYWLAHIMPKGVGLGMLKTRLLVDSMSAYTTKSKDKDLRYWIKKQHQLHFNSFANSQVVWECYIASISNTMAPYVSELTVPTLLVAAELDEVTPVAAVVNMSKKMKSAQVYEIANCGHLVHYEAAQETIDQIKSFIADLSQ